MPNINNAYATTPDVLLRAKVRILGIARLPGNASDLSGLEDQLEDGTPHNRLGGFGSALVYSGHDKTYYALADRGPKDGATSYWTRIQKFEIDALHQGGWHFNATLRSTILLTTSSPNRRDQPLVGSAGSLAFRFDPEGLIADSSGFLIADEYGPMIAKFDVNGRKVHEIITPTKFAINNPASDPQSELPPINLSGRQPNKGFEGLTHDRKRNETYAILQAPLIQDAALDEEGNKIGKIVRILALNNDSRKSRELAYVLDSPKHGVSEILSLGDLRFLVIERDGKRGSFSAFKKIFYVDASSATDISQLNELPCCELPTPFDPVKKSLFIDLVAITRAFDGSITPEKPEGLTLGPDLPNGEKLLLVASDNDFEAEQESWIWAFGIDTK